MEPQDLKEHKARKASRAMKVSLGLQDLMDHGARRAQRAKRDLKGQKEFRDMMDFQVIISLQM